MVSQSEWLSKGNGNYNVACDKNEFDTPDLYNNHKYGWTLTIDCSRFSSCKTLLRRFIYFLLSIVSQNGSAIFGYEAVRWRRGGGAACLTLSAVSRTVQMVKHTNTPWKHSQGAWSTCSQWAKIAKGQPSFTAAPGVTHWATSLEGTHQHPKLRRGFHENRGRLTPKNSRRVGVPLCFVIFFFLHFINFIT